MLGMSVADHDNVICDNDMDDNGDDGYIHH